MVHPNNLFTPIKSLYIIHGEEDLLRIEALDQLRNAAKQQGYLNRETYTVDSHFDWQSLLSEVNCAGLFADLKLLEIHIPNGKPGKNGSEALQQLAEKLPEDTCTVVIFPKLEKAQLQSKWFNHLAKNGQIIEAKAITVAQLPDWIKQRLQQHQLNIETDALALFSERVEGNLLAAKQEIDKLALLHPKGHTVNLEDAKQAIANVARFDVFQLAAAWMSGDLPRCQRLLDGLANDNDEPVLLIWALAEDIRTMIRLTAALNQGKNVAQVRNELRLWGEKQTLMPIAANRISPVRQIKALQTCAQIDRQIKGAEIGNAWDTLRQLIKELTT